MLSEFSCSSFTGEYIEKWVDPSISIKKSIRLDSDFTVQKVVHLIKSQAYQYYTSDKR